MTLWKHLAGTRGVGHCLYLNTQTRELAITDDSIRISNDPSSTDGGLLTVDLTAQIHVTPVSIIIPVRVAREANRIGFVHGDLLGDLPLVVVCRNHGATVNLAEGVNRLAAQLAVLTGGEANPAVYLDATSRAFVQPAGYSRSMN